MTDEFSQDILLKVVAQICQMVGFQNSLNSPLHILVDILRMFICRLGQSAQRYAEHCGHSCPNLRDLSLAFLDFGVKPSDLAEFFEYVTPLPQIMPIPKYPVRRNKASTDTDSSQSLQHIKCRPYNNDQTSFLSTYPVTEGSQNFQCNNEKKEPIKLTISLSKIKAATKTKKNTSKNAKKKKKSKRTKSKK